MIEQRAVAIPAGAPCFSLQARNRGLVAGGIIFFGFLAACMLHEASTAGAVVVFALFLLWSAWLAFGETRFISAADRILIQSWLFGRAIGSGEAIAKRDIKAVVIEQSTYMYKGHRRSRIVVKIFRRDERLWQTRTPMSAATAEELKTFLEHERIAN